mgnify:FL=1
MKKCMKKIKYIIIIILFALTGCLNYVELNDIGIINVIGIDKDNDGYVININMVTPTGDDLEKSTTYEVSAYTLEEAFDRLYLLTSKKINLSHLELVMFSKNLDKTDYKNITNFFLNRNDSRNTFPVVVVENYNKSKIFSVSAYDINSLIEVNSFDDGIVSVKTFDEVTDDILNINISYIPCIKITDKVEILGYYSIYNEQKLLSIRESISYNFLTNKISKCNFVDENLNIKIDSSNTKITINKNKITINITSILTNYTNKKDITNFYNKTLKRYLEEYLSNNDLGYFYNLIKKYNYNYYKNNKNIEIDFNINIESKLNKEV